MTDDRPKVWFEEENERLRELVQHREEEIVDLKKLNAEAVTKTISKSAEGGIAQVQDEADRLARDVSDTLDAVQGLPPTFLDAIISAEVCAVTPIRGSQPIACEVLLNGHGQQRVWQAFGTEAPPKGDYVAIFLLMKKAV